MRKSKLSEKDTRFPDIEAPKRDEVVAKYLEALEGLHEPARTQRFVLLLKDLFGEVQPQFVEDYVRNAEKYVKMRRKDLILRGRVDALYGNAVIEFERDLSERSCLEAAQEQVRKYVACLWFEERLNDVRTPYLCIATDGVIFYAWTPLLTAREITDIKPEHIRLEPISQLDVRRLERPGDLYFWLDRYFVRKELLAPRTENIVQDFGINSHAFHVVANELLALWRRLKHQDEFSVLYSAWEKYLRVVYGSALAADDLFVRHTYLATLAKLMAWARLSGQMDTPSSDELVSILEGRFFKEMGITNFLEEDFFSWPVRGEARSAGVEAARFLVDLLRAYNLRGLSEDVLKALYQELVDPQTRHDLGEYYTPDWLASRILQRVLAENPFGSILDPACGSGTFLYQAIRAKKSRLPQSSATLEHILENVVGFDVHPLAVTIARTNYLLALGDLLKERKGPIAIPVYLCDAIRTPEKAVASIYDEATSSWIPEGFELEIDKEKVRLPMALFEKMSLLDQAIEAAYEFAKVWAGHKPTKEQFYAFLTAQYTQLAKQKKPVQESVFVLAEVLRKRIEARRDTIWAFVLKNSYRPLFLQGRFDLVVGNPPWLSYRYVEQPDYQQFLKGQITGVYRLLSGRGELITQMELGTLFLLRAADLYLKPGGTIAFVLPRSIFSADQHDGLRRRTFKPELGLSWTELWDLEGVEPLFNVPACVLFGVKEVQPQRAQRTQREEELAGEEGIPGEVLSGRLLRRNASLAEAEEALRVERVRFFLNRRGRRSYWATAAAAGGLFSFYRDAFKNGATIYPRQFWFVEVVPSPLGFDPARPPLQTARRAQEEAKEAYRDLVLRGNMEARFLYATLLSTDLLPFGHLDFRPVVLPIEPEGEGYRMLTAEEARRRGFFGLAEWLERAQAEWERRRGAKAEASDLLGWLDYRRKLTSQNPRAAYRVVYIKSGTYLCACMVEARQLEYEVAGQQIGLNGFVVDHVTYAAEMDNQEEADYLVALLNASVVDRLIKPLQSRGQWGPRDIHKKVLDLPIPKYDPEREEHRRLAELGKACSEKVAAWLAAGNARKIRSIGRLRQVIRNMLQLELQQIDHYAQRVLKGRR
ncbi:MAG: N-6 DNA methylase [Thermofilaceae archaeon]